MPGRGILCGVQNTRLDKNITDSAENKIRPMEQNTDNEPSAFALNSNKLSDNFSTIDEDNKIRDDKNYGWDFISNDKNIANSFAILQLSAPISAGGFIQIDKRIHENTVLTFKTPKANLAKMTVSIRDCLGNLFDFGNDASLPTAPTKSLQNTFIFKVTTLEKRRMQLSHRNVY